MIIHRRLIEHNLHSYQPLRNLPLTPSHSRDRLQWCSARSGWNYVNWERIVFSDEYRFQLCPDAHRRRVWRHPGQYVTALLSLSNASQALNQELWFGVPVLLTA
ncbi:transposable element Tc1 transposase [Trichonephila clavipes]|nr:transposable element Tc1 transposase [Trichonephila clavipes]